MIPSAFHWRQTLPLTGNGKIDKKALKALAGLRRAGAPPTTAETGTSAALQFSPRAGSGPAKAGELDVVEQTHEGPNTETEKWLAAAWSEVLGIPRDQIGRQDHFFDVGGTSLSTVRLAIVLDRVVSFKDLTAHPILADQAELIDRRLERGIARPSVAVPAAHCAPARMTTNRREERSVQK